MYIYYKLVIGFGPEFTSTTGGRKLVINTIEETKMIELFHIIPPDNDIKNHHIVSLKLLMVIYKIIKFSHHNKIKETYKNDFISLINKNEN